MPKTNMHALLERYREVSPPLVRDEAAQYRALDVADAVELLALMISHHSYAIQELASGRADYIGTLNSVSVRDQ